MMPPSLHSRGDRANCRFEPCSRRFSQTASSVDAAQRASTPRKARENDRIVFEEFARSRLVQLRWREVVIAFLPRDGTDIPVDASLENQEMSREMPAMAAAPRPPHAAITSAFV